MGLGSFRRADDLIRKSFSLPVTRGETRKSASWPHLRRLVRNRESMRKPSGCSARPLLGSGIQESWSTPGFTRILVGRAEALSKLDRYDEVRPQSSGRWPGTVRATEQSAVGGARPRSERVDQPNGGESDSSTREYEKPHENTYFGARSVAPESLRGFEPARGERYLNNKPDAAGALLAKNLRSTKKCWT